MSVVGTAVGLSAPSMKESVLCVGVSGGTGPRAVSGLVDAGWHPSQLHILSRDPTSRACLSLRSRGCRIVEADLEDEASLARAIRGARFAYIHGTGGDTRTIDQREVERAGTLAAALKASDVSLVAYNSAAAEPDHGVARIEQKRECERAFRDAGLRVCALRANLFMEELWKAYTRPSIIDKQRFTFSVPSGKPMYLTSVRDMGRLAGTIFRRETHPEVLDVASDVRTPAQMAEAFKVDFKQDRLFFWLSKFLAPELHQIIRFYSTSTLQIDVDRLHSDLGPHLFTTFDQFLQETNWWDKDRTYDSLIIEEDDAPLSMTLDEKQQQQQQQQKNF
ncbi:hypothetical protein CTAYLR_002691 [Chrysophaeum taylorii]|uniref:NmrA-like domain-containing protein n=1 Tax=Chrysophaeum taylorii TaxID=2483200 RepID=A0AAD7XKW1_9STRA|nr:hypothetical protein CTAYLR_002691 [Chrysophaeum taylorii]